MKKNSIIRKNKRQFNKIEEYLYENYLFDYNTKFNINSIYNATKFDINKIKIIYNNLNKQKFIDEIDDNFKLNYDGFQYLDNKYKTNTIFYFSSFDLVFTILAIFINFVSLYNPRKDSIIFGFCIFCIFLIVINIVYRMKKVF